MDATSVEFMQETDRLTLCRMLEKSEDCPPHLLYLYQRGRNPYPTFVAWRSDKIVGMLTGSYNSNLAESGAFGAFELPPAPHAFLDRVLVHESARGLGVGRDLIGAYANEAAARGCTFIGGLIDMSSEPRSREIFFRGLGFTVCKNDNFGARTTAVLTTITNGRNRP